MTLIPRTIFKNWLNNHLDITLDILAREMLIRAENGEITAKGVEEIDQLFRELDIDPIPDEDFEICAYNEGYKTIFDDSDSDEDDE